MKYLRQTARGVAGGRAAREATRADGALHGAGERGAAAAAPQPRSARRPVAGAEWNALAHGRAGAGAARAAALLALAGRGYSGSGSEDLHPYFSATSLKQLLIIFPTFRLRLAGTVSPHCLSH